MADRPNIIWLTIESTRADHTSLHGYERDTTPELRRIASGPDGRAFGECFAHGVWTLASSASILSGTYPSRHDTGMESDAFPEELDTAPERLRDAGYHTACLSPNSHLSSATDLDRGFEQFEWLSKSSLYDVAGPRTLAKYAANLWRHSAGLTTDTAKHSTGYVITDVVKRWLRSFAGDDEPFFLYAHYGDPHHAYYPPLPYHDAFTDDIEFSSGEAAELALDHHDDLNELIARGCPFSDDEWEALLAMYDAEIAYTDRLIGHVFDYATDRLDLDDTVFVITADHGELFGEGGMLAHKVVVDDAVTHVPAVVHGMDALTDHDGELLQHADLMETILREVGADTDGMQGIDMRSETRDHAVLQRGWKRAKKNVETFREFDPEFDADRYHTGQLHALRTARFKYQRGDDGGELLRLPDEERDVTAEHPEVAAEMEATLSEWLETVGQPVSDEQREGSFSDEMRDQLADLGYIE
ncbi:sulfatase [Halostella salina]|uniref:sulfatase n=1 Tax=Halostella salina TaxID=1547897 RepID=UPI000EF84213|nr:sulfatase [Halostella salina]